MPEYYYQIKGKRNEKDGLADFSNWVFPPIYSGKVEAKDKKEAKKLIDEEYDKVFPLRVLKKDLDSNDFILKIEEINESTPNIKRLFEIKKCDHCSNQYTIIEKYNDHNCKSKGNGFCSDKCRDDAHALAQYKRNEEYNLNAIISNNSNNYPIIYKITNKITGKSYIGKTTQVFTLRWYQHVFQGGDTKFHQELRSYPFTAWTFEVIEIIVLPEDIRTINEINQYVTKIESDYIGKYNTITEGYNSVISNKEVL